MKLLGLKFLCFYDYVELSILLKKEKEVRGFVEFGLFDNETIVT